MKYPVTPVYSLRVGEMRMKVNYSCNSHLHLTANQGLICLRRGVYFYGEKNFEI